MENNTKTRLTNILEARGVEVPSEDKELVTEVVGYVCAEDEFMARDDFDWHMPGGYVAEDAEESSSDEPTEPTEPTDPTEPTEPTDPTDPTNPNDPGQSEIIVDGPTKVESAEDIAAIENPAEADVELSAELVSELPANTYYKSLAVNGGSIDSTVQLSATESVTLDGVQISGDKGSVNGKITFATPELNIKNITIEEGSTVYNAFEGYQKVNDPNYSGLETLNAENLNFDAVTMAHNVVNVYTPANDAVINIKDSTFNLDVDNSNVLRLSNYMNSENVTVNFENVNWTYENADASDWKWAGLVIYQPAGADVALTGDTSKLATWKFNFTNCKYNDVVVDANNFGAHNQVMYAYNIGGTKAVTDLSEIATVTFA